MISLQFHPYGFVVGLALVVAAQLMEFGIRKLHVFPQKFMEKKMYTWLITAFISGVIGARLWHVMTDFHLYENALLDIVKIWNGGLSILGAVIGAIGGLYLYIKKFDSETDTSSFFKMLDVVVFGLPVGQAIGRVANYINSELYGLPYEGRFKLFIPESRRLPGFESIEYYHPLFAYELFFTAGFAVVFYFFVFNRTKQVKKLIGTTKLFQIYVLYYSLVRFFLDFLRIERGDLYFGLLGFNQLFLLGIVAIILLRYLEKR